MTGLLARTLFKVSRDLGPSQFLEAAGGAAEISRRIDGRVIGADEGYDIADERRVRGAKCFSIPANPRFIAPSSSPIVLPGEPAAVIGVANGSASPSVPLRI